MKIGFIVEWFDIWIGFYYDRKKRRLYFFPVPMVGIYIDFASIKEVSNDVT